MDFARLIDGVTKILMITVIPFFVYIENNIRELTQSIALIQQRLDLRSIERDKQIDLITKILQDQEERLRALEKRTP